MTEDGCQEKDFERATTRRKEDRPQAERRIGPYRLLRELGHGGMGTVYLAARADDQYQKRVAIKVVRGLNTEEIVRYFRRERQILAGLEHPNVARLLDGGSTEDGLPYFVMEYVEGQAIDAYCDEGKLSIEERLRLFQAVCSVVQYAHRNLVVHRDLKPANILVTAEGVPKLLDFGIAKLVNPELAGAAGSVTGLAMTPEYASPEQVKGRPITTATDVYSLGVVLYELLTGRRPYGQKAQGSLELLKAVCEEEPERPSTAVGRTEERTLPSGEKRTTTPESASRTREGTPERLRRRLRGDLDNIVLMALAKEPQRRYPSVEALSEDIRRYLDGLPVHAHKASVRYSALKFVRRHALGVGAASGLILLTVAFGIMMGIQARRIAWERDRARAAAGKADRINSFMREMLASADPRTGSRDVTVAAVLDRASARLETELASEPEIKAAVLTTLGTTYEGLGLFEPAEKHLRAALNTRISVLGAEHLEVARSLHALAIVLEDRGDLKEAERLKREALGMLQRLGAGEGEDAADTLGALARELEGLGNSWAAEELSRRTLNLYRRLSGTHRGAIAATLNNLGVVLGQRGDWTGAEMHHRLALEEIRTLRGPDHPEVAAAMCTLGAVLEKNGDVAGAETIYRDSLAIRQRLLGQEHPDTTRSMYALAHLLRTKKGEPEEAARLCREVLVLRGAALSDSHPMVAATLQLEGLSLMDLGQIGEAEPLLRESLELRRRSLPPGHWLIAASESSLGSCLKARGRYPEAETLMLHGYEGLKSSRGEANEVTVEARQRLVVLYEAWGKPEKAAQHEASPAKGGDTKQGKTSSK